MELTTSAILGFRTRYETILNQAYNLAQPKYKEVAFVFNSGRVAQVLHRWMGGIGYPRELTDERQIANLNNKGFTVTNKLWEKTVGIPRVDLERDQYGIYDPEIQRLGQYSMLHRDQLCFGLLSDALAAGTRASYVAYDGIAFFGTHNTGVVAYTNYTSGGGSVLSESTLSTAIVSLRNRRDLAGAPLAAAQEKPLLVVPPALELTAKKLANQAWYPTVAPGASATQSSSNYAAAGENVLQGMFDVLVSPYLKTSTEWHLMINKDVYKPVIFQLEQELEMLTPPQFFNEDFTKRDQFVVGTRALYNVATGLPEMVYSSVGA